ncbi:MAG TPA: hypothetical protein VFH61_17540 [Thermoleophilia bacterium]|nr:hypothetical protein [Thermoleophilia bacterium]
MGDLVKPELHEDIVYSMVIDGDLGQLTPEQIVGYYYHRCDMLGLDPAEKPFELIVLNGKKQLYTTKAGASALTRVNKLDVAITARENVGGIALVTARASTRSGRFVDDVGAVPIDGLRGESLANAWMKAATKAKRRSVLGCVGLGLLDESELDGVRGERVSIEQLSAPATAANGDADPFMTGRLASKAARAMARCAQVAAAKSTAEKTITPREVWEAACAKFRLPAMPDGSTPKIEHLRKSVAWPICELIKKWSAKLDEVEHVQREPGDDGDEDDPIEAEYIDRGPP